MTTAVYAGLNENSKAQVIPTETLMPPWNVQSVFDPTPLPRLDDGDAGKAPEDTPVRNRTWPGYEPRGVRAGDWMFDPTLSLGTVYDSNIFASNANPQGDIAAKLGASLNAHTLWERHGIDLTASTRSKLFRRNSGLNQTDALLKGRAHYDVDHATTFLTRFKAAYLHEEVGTLTSPAGAVEPTPYTLFSDDTTLRHAFGRFTGSVGGSIDSYSFGTTRAQNGATIDQSARDGQVYTLHGRLEYALSGKTGLFASVAGNERQLRGTSTQSLDSHGYAALAGVDLQLTHLVTGEFAAGYTAQNFADPSIGTVEGPGYRVMLTWSPSRLLDIRANATRTVTEAADTSVSGILVDAAQLGFDYEFRRNIVWSTTGTFENDAFAGQSRNDHVYSVDTNVKYLLNRTNSISVYYRYVQRDSSAISLSYNKHEVGIDVAAHF